MNVKRFILLISAVIGLGIMSCAEAAVPATLHYKIKLKSESFGDMGTREVWIKGKDMRCDMKSARLPITVIKNSQGVFLIHPWQKIAGKYPAGTPRGNPTALLPGPTGSTKVFLSHVKAKKLANEKVGKQLCEVYSYTEPTTKRFCKLWVDAKSRKPVKLWMKGKHKTVDTMVATYTVFEEGVKVSDSLFELPKGYEIRPMPDQRVATAMKKKPYQTKPGS